MPVLKQPMLEKLYQTAKDNPEQICFEFCGRAGDDRRHLTYGDLWHKAQLLAANIEPSEHPEKYGVLLCCKDEMYFIIALVAVFIKGAVAIPAADTSGGRIKERNSYITGISKPDLILHDLDQGVAEALSDIAGGADCLSVKHTIANTKSAEILPYDDAEFSASLLQFSSGSTSEPKPVLLGPQQLKLSCEHIIKAYGLSKNTVGCGWVPLNHDMGLIGNVLVTLAVGCKTILMRPLSFLYAPLSWLDLASRVGATIITGPNFAFDMLNEAVSKEPEQDIDLSALDSIILGSEPVQRATVDRFCELFEPFALNIKAIKPSYGLAEAGLLVAAGQAPHGKWHDDRESERALAPFGAPMIDIKIDILEEETGAPVEEGETGALYISGEGVGIQIPKGQDWREAEPAPRVATGDYGFREGGQLYLTGRIANKIILRGRNIMAEDIELAANEIMPDIPLNQIAACGIDQDGTQVPYLFIEVGRKAAELDTRSLAAKLGKELGVKIAKIVQLKMPAFPRTSSGKIRRKQLASDWLSGGLAGREN